MNRYFIYIFSLVILVALYPANPAASGTDDIVRLDIAELDGKVEIRRDKYGVPHIWAENEDDLFFAFGYITAADRLFHLDGSRRVALGQVSELFGKRWRYMDQTNRNIGFGRIGEEMYPNLAPETRRSLDQYTAGINHYIETHQGRLPLEFKLLKYEPALWKATDSLAIMRMFDWWLSSDRSMEKLRTYFRNYYGEEFAMALLPPVPEGSEAALPAPISGAGYTDGDVTDAPLEKVRPVNGSNCWVVGPEKTADGYAILASDPHVELFAPSSWYQVHLTGGDIDVIGISFPGLPAIPIGHNRHVAWGASNMPFDTQDYTLLRVNGGDPVLYQWGNEWLEFEVEDVRISCKSKGGLEVQDHKRLLSKAGFVVHKGTYYLALRWTGSEANDDLTPLMDLMRMELAEDLSDALATFNCAPQNFIAADIDGHITQVFAGKVPVRENHSGLISMYGVDGPTWVGMMGTNDLPFITDPSCGYIAHANNLPEYCIGTACGNFKAPYIYRRLCELLETDEPIDVEYVREMQMDVYSEFAKKYVEYIMGIAPVVDEPAANIALALELLSNWDYCETEDSSAATLFHEWFVLFTEDIFRDVMNSSSYAYYEDSTNAMDGILDAFLRGEGNPLIFRDLTPDDAAEIAVNALGKAVAMLNERYGEGPEEWRWGHVHHTRFKHPSGVDFLLGGGEYPDRGSRYTIKVTDFFNSERYISTFGVSYRQVVEMRPDDIRGLWILPPGNHGSSLSPHYRDQVDMWLKGELAPMWFYEDDVRENCALAAIFGPGGDERDE